MDRIQGVTSNRGIKLSDEEWERLQRAAKSEHLPTSTFVRKLLLDWLETHEQELEVK